MVRIENNINMLDFMCEVAFIRFFKAFFGTYSLKVVKTWFARQENWNTTLFGIYCCFAIVKIEKKNSHMF